MKRAIPFLVFFILNFGALAIGGLFTGSGVASEWYTTANQAPWTPPGWVFGAAWTFIMLCYTIYMGIAWNRTNSIKMTPFYVFQWLLNVGWNPVFFYFHQTLPALLIIVVLTLLLLLKIILFRHSMKGATWLIVPYFIWLCIATSLNAYIVIYN